MFLFLGTSAADYGDEKMALGQLGKEKFDRFYIQSSSFR